MVRSTKHLPKKRVEIVEEEASVDERKEEEVKESNDKEEESNDGDEKVEIDEKEGESEDEGDEDSDDDDEEDDENDYGDDEDDDVGDEGDYEDDGQQGDGFANAMSSLLQQDTGNKVPVLAGRKTALMKQLEKSQLENAELREKRIERKKKLKNFMTDPSNVNVEFERQLRKLATKGVVALFNAVAKAKRDAADTVKSEKLKKKAQLKAAGATVGLSITNNDDHSVGSGGSLSIDSFLKNTETSLLKKRSLRDAENAKDTKKKRSNDESAAKNSAAETTTATIKNKGWKVISDNLEEDVSLDWDKEDI